MLGAGLAARPGGHSPAMVAEAVVVASLDQVESDIMAKAEKIIEKF